MSRGGVDPLDCAQPLEGCAIVRAPECSGCGEGELCGFDDRCRPTCSRACDLSCPSGELCQLGEGVPSCRPPIYTMGSLTVEGAAGAVRLEPPQIPSGDMPEARFASGARLTARATGTTRAGLAAFDVGFDAVTHLEKTSRVDAAQFYGDAPVEVTWVPGDGEIEVRIDGRASAVCPADDARGAFTVPRSVFEVVVGNA